MNSFSIQFDSNPLASPLWLLLIIPAVVLTILPYFLFIRKNHRRTRNRVVSIVLHTLIAAFLISLLSGMTFRNEKFTQRNDVIILVDASDSTRKSTGEIDGFVKRLLDQSGGKYNMGVLTFAKNTVFETGLSRNTDSVYDDYKNAEKPIGAATNIGEALKKAGEELSNPDNGRIILLSDGAETDGSASAAAKELALKGYRIDSVFFESKTPENEVRIVDVEQPPNAAFGERTTLYTTVQGQKTGTAYVSIFDNGVEIEEGEQQVFLPGGSETNRVPLYYTPKDTGLHELRLTVRFDGDEIQENNSYYTFVSIPAERNILIIEGKNGESASFKNALLESGDFNVSTVQISSGLPRSVSELQAYDEVILVNASNAALTAADPRFIDNLDTYTRDFGGGLLTIGGDEAYKEEDMSGSKFESILPVTSATASDPLALLVIIDSSSSMSNDSPSRISQAKQGAIAMLGELNDSDYMGVIQFDSRTIRRSDFLPASRTEDLEAAINSINSGNGTFYTMAMLEAEQMMMNFNETPLKHIVFISDGDNQESNRPEAQRNKYREAIRRINQNTGATLSTFAVGGDISENAINELRLMAESDGKGVYYRVQSSASLAADMAEEAERVTPVGSWDNAVTFAPFVNDWNSPSMQNMAGKTFPDVNGYYGTKGKDGATVVLSRGAGGRNPLYTEWAPPGINGKIGSLSTSAVYLGNYFSNETGKIFLRDLVLGLMPDAGMNTNDIRTAISGSGTSKRLLITTPMQGAGGERYLISATLTDPNDVTITLPLSEDSGNPNARFSEFTADITGLYKVTVEKRNRADNSFVSSVTTYSAFSYFAEYNSFHNTNDCTAFMRTVAENGSGTLFFVSDQLFGENAETIVSVFDPKTMFLIFAAVLFLLDVIVRNFKFKWPWEIYRERKAKKAETHIKF